MQLLILLQLWARESATWWTVIGPALGFAVALVMAPGVRKRVPLVLVAGIVCWPVSHALSWWDAGGLHVVPVVVMAYAVLVMLGLEHPDSAWGLKPSRDWIAIAFGVWASTLLPDLSGAWSGHAAGVYWAPTWWWGIGGYGIEDALVTYTVSMPVVLWGLEVWLAKRWTQGVSRPQPT